MTTGGFSSPVIELTVRDLMEVIGGLVAIFAVHLHRGGIASIDEIDGQLGLFATITNETSPVPGAILAYWSGVIAQAIGPGAGADHDR